jgi:hypothetical protein
MSLDSFFRWLKSQYDLDDPILAKGNHRHGLAEQISQSARAARVSYGRRRMDWQCTNR